MCPRELPEPHTMVKHVEHVKHVACSACLTTTGCGSDGCLVGLAMCLCEQPTTCSLCRRT